MAFKFKISEAQFFFTLIIYEKSKICTQQLVEVRKMTQMTQFQHNIKCIKNQVQK